MFIFTIPEFAVAYCRNVNY